MTTMMHREHHEAAAALAPPFDQWRRVLPGTGTFELVERAIKVTADVRTRGGSAAPRRKRKLADQRTYEALAHAVVSALVNRELTQPRGWTRVPLAHQRTGRNGKDGSSRYRSPSMSRSLPAFVHALWELGWLELELGSTGTKERVSSVMRAGPWLAQQVQALGCKLTDFTRDPDQEMIVLKGRKPTGRDGRGRQPQAEWIDYADTSETEQMRAEMKGLNTWLAAANIDYVQAGEGVDALGDRALRRVFNNGSFEEGGRLFGGFWLNMPMSRTRDRPWRGYLRIEGQPIVALDFVSMFMRLLYVKAGVQAPSGDLLAGIEGIGPEYRGGVKRVIYSMLFQDGELTRCPRGTRLLLPKGIHIRSLVKNITKRHAPVAHLFGTAIGMRLFRLESDILLEVLRECREAGIVALPVHDAVLVAESRAEEAKRVMLTAFSAVTGFRGEIGEPKCPAVDAPELETMTMPDDVRNLEDDPYELQRVMSILRDGHRESAAQIATEYMEARHDRRPETPDTVGDWT